LAVIFIGVVDVADDGRWRCYLEPSPLGCAYLNNSPEVPHLRRIVRGSEVDLREAPDGNRRG